MSLKTMKLKKQSRSYPVTIDNVRTAEDGSKTGALSIAISSEYPVFRQWPDGDGYEILDHTDAAIDLSMLRNSGPFCLEHMTWDQVGVLQNVRLDEDKVLRADVRFSRSQAGQDTLNDMVDGIRPHISVGYAIQKMKIERNANKPTTYRVTQWMPFEVSSVSIPADPTVGVGRSALRNEDDAEYEVEVEDTTVTETEETAVETPSDDERQLPDDNNMSNRHQEQLKMDKTEEKTVEVSVSADHESTRKNAVEIAKLAAEHGFTNKTAEWIEAGRSVESVAQEILGMKSNERSIKTADPVVLTEKENKEFSITRAILNAANGNRTGFEFEVSDEIAKRTGRETNGFYVPTSVRTALDSKTSTTGTEIVFTQAGPFIDLLRAKTRVVSLGAQVMSGLTTKTALPRQTATGNGSWVAENGAGASQVNMTFDQVTLSPKMLVSPQAYSKQLLMLGSYDVEQLIRNDMAASFAVLFDLAAINGSGSSQPTGIFQTTGVQTGSLGVSGSAATYAGIVQLETLVAAANADVGQLAYLTTPGVRGNLKTTLRNPTGSASDFVWQPDNSVNGYKADVSTNVPSNLTKNTVSNLHGVIFGNWASIILAEFGAFEVVVDPYTSKNKGLIELTGTMFGDVGIRQPTSFAILKDVVVT